MPEGVGVSTECRDVQVIGIVRHAHFGELGRRLPFQRVGLDEVAAGVALCQTSSSRTPSITIGPVVRLAVICRRPSGDVMVDWALTARATTGQEQITASFFIVFRKFAGAAFNRDRFRRQRMRKCQRPRMKHIAPGMRV